MLQSTFFLLQFLSPSGLFDFHVAVLAIPDIEGQVTYSNPAV